MRTCLDFWQTEHHLILQCTTAPHQYSWEEHISFTFNGSFGLHQIYTSKYLSKVTVLKYHWSRTFTHTLHRYKHSYLHSKLSFEHFASLWDHLPTLQQLLFFMHFNTTYTLHARLSTCTQCQTKDLSCHHPWIGMLLTLYNNSKNFEL